MGYQYKRRREMDIKEGTTSSSETPKHPTSIFTFGVQKKTNFETNPEVEFVRDEESDPYYIRVLMYQYTTSCIPIEDKKFRNRVW